MPLKFYLSIHIDSTIQSHKTKQKKTTVLMLNYFMLKHLFIVVIILLPME